jgi:hypothetical protein
VLAPLEQISESRPASALPADAELTACPLTGEEHIRLLQLERIVEKNLDGLLAAGKALAEIRSSRLYRQHFTTFEQYVRERWALSRSRADELCRSNNTAELLLANGMTLPQGISEAALRPVSSLPSAELQVASWQLIQAASPACGPTQPLAAKIVRTIKNAIESPSTGSNGHKPRSRSHPSRERPFVQAAQRLSAYEGFEPGMVTSHIEKLPSAWSVYTACGKLAERCRLVQERLAERFPELLTDAQCWNNQTNLAHSSARYSGRARRL